MRFVADKTGKRTFIFCMTRLHVTRIGRGAGNEVKLLPGLV